MAAKNLENLVSYYHENKISHAYLIETNNFDKCYEDLLVVIKKIFCQNEYSEECNKCNICNLINQNYLPSFKVIEPSGSTIKKEQILDLKRSFSSIPIYTKDNIYVIKNAEKLTDASANTMLKFIEEPEEHILGFFITNNINNVISTIKSRCEILKVMYDEKSLDANSMFKEEYKNYLDVANSYLYKLEVEKTKSIMYNKDVLLSNFNERTDIIIIFNILLIIYEELLKRNLNLLTDFDFNNYQYLTGLNKNQILKRIELITKFLDDIDSNANIELLVDKFVIELSDING